MSFIFSPLPCMADRGCSKVLEGRGEAGKRREGRIGEGGRKEPDNLIWLEHCM